MVFYGVVSAQTKKVVDRWFRSATGQPHQGGLCFGDSGGPVLYGTTILAVNSFVINGNCAGSGYSYRIDQPEILAWINSFL
jgi:hypothetical protein